MVDTMPKLVEELLDGLQYLLQWLLLLMRVR